MAEVAIDIAAMQSMVTGVDRAIEDMPACAGELRGNLSSVGLSSQPVDACAWDGEIASWLASSSRDLNRRLSMARMIQRSTPSLGVVHFDDDHLSTASDAEIKRRVNRVKELLKVDDTDRIDPELLGLLQDNALDPYFAKAMAEQISPELLDGYLKNMLAGYYKVPHADPSGEQPSDSDPPTSWELLGQDYAKLNEALGITFGLASQGTGSLKVPDMGKQWADYIRKLAKTEGGTPTLAPQPGQPTSIPDGGPIRLSMVIGKGQWSDDFLVDVYHAVRDSEGDAGADAWSRGDALFLDDEPMKGVMTALQLNPGAVRRIFASGPRETITVRGEPLEVNSEMYAFLKRNGTAAEAFIKALQSAIASPPVPGGKAWQPELAGDVEVLGKWIDEQTEIAEQKQKEAEEEAGPLWKRIGHGLLDLAGLVPVFGEAFDGVNGLWYYADGDVINGSLSMASVIPFAGWAAQGGKWIRVGFKAEELAKLTRLAEDGRAARIFLKDGKLASKEIDLADPENFRPDRFLSDRELELWSGPRSFMQRVIAGNRFNAFANAPYKFTEITLTTKRVRGFRLDAYAPPNEIVSRKLTQLGTVQSRTAKGYIDEFVKKYPPGTLIADTAKNRELGLAGKPLRGKMVLEVPPQYGGKLPSDIVEYAESHGVFIRDINGHWYTKAPKGGR